MNNTAIAVLLIVFPFTTVAQTPPAIEWQQALGGSEDDYAVSVDQTSDGGFIVAGLTLSNDGDITGHHGGWDYWIVKLDGAGTIQWQKSLGGSGTDEAYSIEQTTDGGYIVAGNTLSNDGDVTGHHGSWDYWIVKLDGAGTIQWQRAMGGSGLDYSTSIEQCSDGGYIVAGEASSINGDVTGHHGDSDYWIVKLDDAGAIQWQKALGGSGTDEAFSIEQTTDGGFIVAGLTLSNDGDVTGHHGGWDYWIVKLDGGGTIQWQSTMGGSGYDVAGSIEQTADGGYIIAGSTYSNDGDVSGHHGDYDMWIVKLDDAGAIQWQKALGGSEEDGIYSIVKTTDGGFIVAGATDSNDGDVTGNHGGYDYWIIKLDGSGTIQWQKTLGGSGYDVAVSIEQTVAGGYIIAGYTYSTDGDVTGNHGYYDCWIVKLDDAGAIRWQRTLGGAGAEIAGSIEQTADGGYIIEGVASSNNGDVIGNHGAQDFWIVKLAPEGVGVEEVGTVAFSISPNPSNGSVRIELPFTPSNASITVTDVLGRELLHRSITGTATTLDLRDQPCGVCTVTLRSAQGISSQRLVLE